MLLSLSCFNQENGCLTIPLFFIIWHQTYENNKFPFSYLIICLYFSDVFMLILNAWLFVCNSSLHSYSFYLLCYDGGTRTYWRLYLHCTLTVNVIRQTGQGPVPGHQCTVYHGTMALSHMTWNPSRVTTWCLTTSPKYAHTDCHTHCTMGK